MKCRLKRTSLACTVAATVFGSQHLLAQAVLEEVVVTAQKRAQGLQDVPEWTATLAAEYTQPIGSDFDLRLRVDMNYSDDYYATADLDENTVQDSYTKYNASVIFGPLDGQWDLSLISRNLTDEETFSYANDVPLFTDSHFVGVEPGRTIAVRGRYRF